MSSKLALLAGVLFAFGTGCVVLDPPPCEVDADCPGGEVCEPSGPGCGPLECVPGCHTDDQCDEGESCALVECFTCPCPGTCMATPEPECVTDDDCSDGTVCEGAGPNCNEPACVVGCHADDDCAQGQTCTQVQCITCPCPGLCEDAPEPDCVTDDDCPDGTVCEGAGPNCNEPTCVAGCHADDDCGAGQTCNQVQCITCPCPGLCED